MREHNDGHQRVAEIRREEISAEAWSLSTTTKSVAHAKVEKRGASASRHTP